jgi:hypothetical protein
MVDQVPVLTSSRNKVAQLYTQTQRDLIESTGILVI